MSNSFFDKSKEIANGFLQSIVFIDDRAFATDGPNNHDFDAKQITQVFAKTRKICAVYNPETRVDIENLALLIKKADVAVLDWQINLKEVVDSSEKDADDDDPRGPHTKRIISEILSDPLTGKGSIKLILIYTGEIDLPGITDEIYDYLNTINIEGLKKGDCSVFTENIKILVVAKPASEDDTDGLKFKHNPKLNSKVIPYNQLPDFILTQFTLMTAGLLTNFVLKSLTVIRSNTFRLIKLYNKELDPSFLVHRILLPNPTDSEDQLVEILSHSLEALLNYNEVGQSVSTKMITPWFDQSRFSSEINISKKTIILNNDFLKKLCSNGIFNTLENYWSKHKYGEPPKSLYNNFQSLIHENGSTYLSHNHDTVRNDSEFSMLTHHKSNLKQPATTPKLSLGSIVKLEGTTKYLICIQAKCDSARISSERKFLFLPLTSTEENKFQFVVEEDGVIIRLQLIKNVYELKTIKFSPIKKSHFIVGVQDKDNNYYFTSIYKEKLKWICDLKDAHAQRVANVYGSQLSRVGLDESEWLRRSAGYE